MFMLVISIRQKWTESIELKVQAYFYHTIEIEKFSLDKGNIMLINVFNFDTAMKYIYSGSNLLDIEFGRMSWLGW